MNPPDPTETLDRWQNYLETMETYGTFEQRCPEYFVVAKHLSYLGLKNDDLVVDVGAGTCDMDHYLRTRHGWRGRYLPIDGATHGVDFNQSMPRHYLPNAMADFYVSIETLEHVYEPQRLVEAMMNRTRRGLIVTTPNADIVDVIAVDSTHVYAITPFELRSWGFSVFTVTLNDRGEGDTLVGIWTPEEEFPSG